MIWLIGMGAVFILLIILLLITKVHIMIYYSRIQDDDSLIIKFRAWGFLVYTLDVPEISLDKDSPSLVFKEKKKAVKMKQKESDKKITKDDLLANLKTFHHLLERVDGLHRTIKRFLGKMTVSRFRWHTCFGLGDAAWTGMVAGGVWMVKGNIIGLLDHYMQMAEPPDLSVEPMYQGVYTQTDLACMISFRIGHAMGAVLQIVTFWKGRRSAWQKGKNKSIRSRV